MSLFLIYLRHMTRKRYAVSKHCIFFYTSVWIIFPDKMTFFRLSHEVNSKHMFVIVCVKYVEMQISLSETHEGVKTKNKADMEGSKYLAQIAFLLLENNSKRSKILQI
jgi:hypothetical protein